MKQAIIYCRFSPRPDQDTSKSNKQQKERCSDYCYRKGYVISGRFCDSAVSGKRLQRPELSKALANLRPGMILVVDTVDRLARDVLVSLTIRNQVEKLGATIEFADGTPNNQTPEGKLIANIFDAFAQFEREKFAARTKAGLAKKKANGEYLGKPPWGYRVVNKHLVENPEALMAIKRIKEIGALGYTSGYIRSCIVAEFGISPSARTIRKFLAKKT